MVKPEDPATAPAYTQRDEHTVLVLQGGGALGAYQAGVYEALSETGFAPDWVTGVSIGAVNAALIAGNAPEQRLPRLREFWDRVSSGIPLVPPKQFDPLRRVFNLFSASSSVAFGVPGFFRPRFPPPMFAPDGSSGALSFYDSAPLRQTLLDLVDFDLVNAKRVRLAVGAVHVGTGNSTYFDNTKLAEGEALGPEHVMASGALPPGLPPVLVKGEPYWDGGLVSNTPLWYVLDESPHLAALVMQVDLFSARGETPANLDQVLERQKDIQYSSKTRFNTSRLKDLEALRDALRRVLARLPDECRSDPDVALLDNVAMGRKVAIVHLINRRFVHSSQSKDYEFSRATVRTLWDAGRDAVRRTVANPQWQRACQRRQGVETFDLAY